MDSKDVEQLLLAIAKANDHSHPEEWVQQVLANLADAPEEPAP